MKKFNELSKIGKIIVILMYITILYVGIKIIFFLISLVGFVFVTLPILAIIGIGIYLYLKKKK